MAQTLRNIAQQLNLSVSTVSYALNGGPKPVSPQVRKRVLKKAQEMGYRPNRIAQSLSTGRTRAVGVVPMYVDRGTLLQPFTVLAMNGICDAANDMGHDILMFTAFDRNRPKDAARDFLDSRADGLIFISPGPSSPALHSISESDLPYAVLYEDCVGPSFTVNNDKAVRDVLDHLVTLGHRRIAHISGSQVTSDGQRRRAAFVAYMEERQIPVPDDYIIEGDFSRKSGYAAGLEFMKLSPRPTAVCSGNECMTRGFADALRDHGLRCPQDVSLASCDCVPLPTIEPPIFTSSQQPVELIAAEAVRSVIRQIESGNRIESKVFEPEFVIRGSTAPIP